MSIKTSTIFLW